MLWRTTSAPQLLAAITALPFNTDVRAALSGAPCGVTFAPAVPSRPTTPCTTACKPAGTATAPCAAATPTRPSALTARSWVPRAACNAAAVARTCSRRPSVAGRTSVMPYRLRCALTCAISLVEAADARASWPRNSGSPPSRVNHCSTAACCWRMATCGLSTNPTCRIRCGELRRCRFGCMRETGHAQRDGAGQDGPRETTRHHSFAAIDRELTGCGFSRGGSGFGRNSANSVCVKRCNRELTREPCAEVSVRLRSSASTACRSPDARRL